MIIQGKVFENEPLSIIGCIFYESPINMDSCIFVRGKEAIAAHKFKQTDFYKWGQRKIGRTE